MPNGGMLLKVLHVSAVGEHGGLEAILLNILSCLDRSRVLPQVVLLQDGPFVNELRETETKTQVIPCGRIRNLADGFRTVIKLVQLIRTEGIDLVHSHNAKAHIYGGLAAAIAGIPSMYHLHGVPRLTLSRDGLVSLLSVLVPARVTVACSAYVAGAFGHAWRSKRRMFVLHNGVIMGRPMVRDSSPTIRDEFGIPHGHPLVLMVSRLQRWKGVHVFLDAAAEVVKRFPEAEFLVVGGTQFRLEKEYAGELRQQVARLELTEAVRFAGFRSDVFRFYEAADLVVHSSIEPEPFGMVLLEAMACAKPVVASDCGGPREIVDSGLTGLLFAPGDATELAQAIVSLLKDPARRSRMGQAGAARLRSHFGAEKMVEQLQALYLEMAV
jgi:glycosyltransferase involved in cell wall biosynthesis